MSGTFHVGVILDQSLRPGPALLAELEKRFPSVLVPNQAEPGVLFIQVGAESLLAAIDQVVTVVEQVVDARVKAVYASAGDPPTGLV